MDIGLPPLNPSPLKNREKHKKKRNSQASAPFEFNRGAGRRVLKEFISKNTFENSRNHLTNEEESGSMRLDKYLLDYIEKAAREREEPLRKSH